MPPIVPAAKSAKQKRNCAILRAQKIAVTDQRAEICALLRDLFIVQPAQQGFERPDLGHIRLLHQSVQAAGIGHPQFILLTWMLLRASDSQAFGAIAGAESAIVGSDSQAFGAIAGAESAIAGSVCVVDGLGRARRSAAASTSIACQCGPR